MLILKCKNYFNYLATISILTLLSGCWNSKKEVDNKENTAKLKIVNVLDNALYDDVHIKGSINIPFGKVQETALAEKWDLDAPIVLYCSNYECTASGIEAKKLQDMGFKNVYAYEGGMAEWYNLAKAQPDAYQFEGLATQEYLKLPNEKPKELEKHDYKIIAAQELKN